jgi:hypothetical protein
MLGGKLNGGGKHFRKMGLAMTCFWLSIKEWEQKGGSENG